MNKKMNDTFSFTTAHKFVHWLVGEDTVTRNWSLKIPENCSNINNFTLTLTAAA